MGAQSNTTIVPANPVRVELAYAAISRCNAWGVLGEVGTHRPWTAKKKCSAVLPFFYT